MKSIKTNISVFILLFVNFVFTYKYSSRLTDLAIYIAVILFILQYLVYKYNHLIRVSARWMKIVSYGLLIGLLGLVVIIHLKIPLESLNVDRWSVISSFLTEAFNGNYPYYAKSHLGNNPGPMPVYFLIALPFYLIGELSILSFLGYGLFIFLMMKRLESKSEVKFLLFYLATSVYVLWEITTRSNVFTNSVLILVLLNEYLNFRHSTKLKFIILALLTGFLLSTRSIFVIVYIVFFLSSLINKETSLKKLSLFITIAVISFVSTFLPFILIFKNAFFLANPFIIQSSVLVPQIYTFGFILISVLLAFFVRNKADKFFYSGLSLFVSILIYSLYHLVNFGFQQAFTESSIDISYFIFCIPFLMMYLIENTSGPKSDKPLAGNN